MQVWSAELRMKERRQLRRCVLLHRWQGMGIDVERHFDPLIAEPLLYHLDRNARLQQQCRTRMA